MANTPRERLSILREKIERQRTTVDALKRDGHECADAERQLHAMLAELQRIETPLAAQNHDPVGRPAHGSPQ